jgi:hypothetical protein
MKILIKRLILLLSILICWIICLVTFYIKGWNNALEVIETFPGLLLITIGYYAICNVCYSILFISDCINEHKELLDDIEEGRNFFKQKGIKYN